MATTFQWVAPTSPVTYASGSLNSLANGSFSSVTGTTIIDNQANLYQYINLELLVGPLSPAAGAYCDIWLYPSLDGGTTFASDSKALQTTNVLAAMQLDTTASTSQRLIVTNRIIPPLAFKLAVRNGSGVQFSGIGAAPNTLKYTLHNEQGV